MASLGMSGRHVSSWAPGRTELAGNHTDHQGGRVIAATVDKGVSMRVRPNGSSIARVASEGFDPVELDVRDLEPRAGERFTTAALVRGVVAGLVSAGVPVEGFDALAESSVPPGGGLSSSAAFELSLVQALNVMFASGSLGALSLARIAQAAERGWFGKPCGLMDQLSIALGGANLMDFSGGACSWTRLDCALEDRGLALFLIDTHCDHSRYTNDYAQVAKDMDELARFLGVQALGEVSRETFLDALERVRAKLGDLVALRGLHFFNEMDLVELRRAALDEGDMQAFLAATRRSGASSAQYLQNVSTFDRASQPAMVALALADTVLAGEGAARIHGGGFGGTVQAFVPVERARAFAQVIDGHLGPGSCRRYRIVEEGARAHWEGELSDERESEGA